jgi:hypothetical protein
MANLGTFGGKPVRHWFGKSGTVFGFDSGVYDNIITGSRFQGIAFIEPAGQSTGIKPAPLAIYTWRYGDRNFSGITLHAPHRHYVAVKLKYDLSSRRHIITSGGDTNDIQPRRSGVGIYDIRHDEMEGDQQRGQIGR